MRHSGPRETHYGRERHKQASAMGPSWRKGEREGKEWGEREGSKHGAERSEGEVAPTTEDVKSARGERGSIERRVSD